MIDRSDVGYNIQGKQCTMLLKQKHVGDFENIEEEDVEYPLLPVHPVYTFPPRSFAQEGNNLPIK